MGSQVRRWPLRPAVKPSVQRRMYGARTVPYGVYGVLGLDLGDGRRFVDGDAESLDGVGEALDEFDRVQAGAVRGPGGADGSGDADAFGGLAGAAQDAVGLAEGDLHGVEVLEAGQLGGGVRDFEDAAPVDVGVDVLLGGDAYDFVDGVVHRLLEADGGVVAVEFRVAVAARDAVVEPAAVAPGGAVAAELGFQDGDVEEGDGLLEVVGGPQAGVSAADDADVGRAVAGQGLAGGGSALIRVPERYSAVDRADGAHVAPARPV